MAKKKTAWLITAAVLIVTGCMIFGGAMVSLGWDFTKLSTSEFETNTYEITEVFRNISVDTDTADLEFAPAEDGKCTVVCHEHPNAKHRVQITGDTLYIEVENTRKWYDHIGIHIGAPKITVYLPLAEYEALTVKEDTGKVTLPADFSFETADITSSTGAVSCRASVSGQMKIKASTGDITLEALSAKSIGLSVSTGRVIVKDVTCDGEMKIKVSTGKASVTNVRCRAFESTGSTGGLQLENVVASERMTLRRSTGNVKLTRCDAAELYIELDTGDVTGSLLTEKVFIVHSDTGRVDVPKSITGGRCEITTDTGDIRITVE